MCNISLSGENRLIKEERLHMKITIQEHPCHLPNVRFSLFSRGVPGSSGTRTGLDPRSAARPPPHLVGASWEGRVRGLGGSQ